MNETDQELAAAVRVAASELWRASKAAHAAGLRVHLSLLDTQTVEDVEQRGGSGLCIDNAMLGWKHVVPAEACADTVAAFMALPDARRKPRGPYHVRAGK